MTRDHKLNERAYRRLKPRIDRTYSAGQYVAIADGRVVADAAELDALDARLSQLGLDPITTLVVQAGVDYPDNVTIFL